MYRDHSLLYQWKWNRIFPVCAAFLSSFCIKSYYSLHLSYLNGYVVFLIFLLETVKAEEEDQAGPQAQESLHDSSTDSCLTFPYSSNSPRPFPPSPVHSTTDSPIRVSPLFIAISNPSSNNSPIQGSISHNSPTSGPSTPNFMPSQTPTSILSTSTTNSSSNPFYTPYFSSSFPQTGPIVIPGSPPDFLYFKTTLSGSDSTFPLPSMVTPTTIPIPFFSTGSQSTSGPGSFRNHGRSSRGAYSGRGRAPRSRRGKITSTTSCQTSPITSYFWPDYQPSPISSRGSSANYALNLALMPKVFEHFPTNLPLDPLHYDFFTILRAASPVVTFHCPSPLTQRSFSFVYLIKFPHGLGSKPLLIAGINQ